LKRTDSIPFNSFNAEFAAREIGAYRYGFNGKELDKPGMGGGQSTYDYGFRIYNPAIAKFLSVDPLTRSFPWNSPYSYAENGPVENIDLDGKERFHYTRITDEDGNSKLVYTHTEDIIETNYKVVFIGIVPVLTKAEIRNTRVEFVVHDKFLNPIAGKSSVKWQWYNEIAVFGTYDEATKAKRSDFNEDGFCFYCFQTGLEAVADEHRDGRAPGAVKNANYAKRKAILESNKSKYPKVPLEKSLKQFEDRKSDYDIKYSNDGAKRHYENDNYRISYDMAFGYYRVFDKVRNQYVGFDGKVPNASAAGRKNDESNFVKESTHILDQNE
jgi:RHS repeat-associated protein